MKFNPILIQKFEPGGGLKNVLGVENSTYQSRMDPMAMFENLLGSYLNNKDTLDDEIKLINGMQKSHHGLFTSHNGVQNTVNNSDDNVQTYQQKIIDKFNYLNDRIRENQENYVKSNKTVTGDRYNETTGKWGTDKSYGQYTDDRRVLGRVVDGKDDYTEEQKREINNKLKEKGLEMYLDPKTNYYMIRKLGQQDGTIPPRTGTPPGQDNPGNNPTNPGNPSNPRNPSNSPVFNPDLSLDWGKFTPTEENPKKPGWSDWLPLTLQRTNDLIGSIRDRNYVAQKRFPPIEVPQYDYKITNGYYTRSELAKNANDVRAQARRYQTSDLDSYLKVNDQAETQAEKIESQIGQHKADEYGRTAKEATAVANQNIDQRIKGDNYNLQQVEAKRNNILLANQQLNEKNIASLNSYIGNRTTSYGEYLRYKRLNENAAKRGEIGLNAAQQQEENLKQYFKLAESPENTPIISDFVSAIINDPELNTKYNLPRGITWTQLTPEQKASIKQELLEGTSAKSVEYRNKFNRYLEQVKDQVLAQNRLIDYRAKYAALQIDPYVTNQFGPNINSRSGASPLFAKKGTTLDKLSNFIKQVQRESESVRKEQQKANEKLYDHLNKSLERLNKEQLILLRQAFK